MDNSLPVTQILLPSIVTSFISLVIGMGISVFIFPSPNDRATWLKRIAVSLLTAAVGFLLAQAFETRMSTLQYASVLTDVSDKADLLMRMNTYISSINATRSKPVSPFRLLLETEVDDLDDRLNQIVRGELRLKREEVIPRWEKLICGTTKNLDATNIVSAKDWEQFSPSEGIEVHRAAKARGVQIRRIMIYDERDSDHQAGLLKLAETQKDYAELRKLSTQRIAQSSFLSELMRDLGTNDVVIFDANTVLLTTTDQNMKIVQGKVTTDPHLLKKAQEFFEKLWAGADPLFEKATKKTPNANTSRPH